MQDAGVMVPSMWPQNDAQQNSKTGKKIALPHKK
jgi:hypothetical protein